MNDELKHSALTEMILVNTENLSSQGMNLREVLLEIELAYIKEALNKCNGIVTHAAMKLGMRRTTLIEKIKKHKLQARKLL